MAEVLSAGRPWGPRCGRQGQGTAAQKRSTTRFTSALDGASHPPHEPPAPPRVSALPTKLAEPEENP